MHMNETLKTWVRESRRIVFFGGAGVSTESGIPDFRSVDGLYNQKYDYPPEEILSAAFFRRMPEAFFRFYRDKILKLDAQPNPAHKKLAEWEKEGKLAAIVTQNIDGDVINASLYAIANADLLIVGGTSLNVYPAAGMIDAYRGDRMVLINKTPTPCDDQANLIIRDPIGQVFSEL